MRALPLSRRSLNSMWMVTSDSGTGRAKVTVRPSLVSTIYSCAPSRLVS